MKKAVQALLSALKPWVPLFAILMPAVLGAALVVNGVFILAGAGWAYIASGLCMALVAGIIRRGVYNVG